MRDRNYLALMTRVGFAARGLLYIVLGLLVVNSGRIEGPDGVLRYMGSGFGKWLLILMIVGFVGYGLWRLGDAFLGTEHHGHDKKSLAERVGAGASALIHLFLAWQAVKLATEADRSSGGATASDQAEMILDLPAGQLLLGAIAIGLAVAGVFQLVKSIKCTFLADLDLRAQDEWVKWVGRAGYGARGVVFLLAAWFLIDAALSGQSEDAAGIEQILAWLKSPMNLAVAAGLFLFGVYSLVEARYRRIHVPNVDRLAAEMRR